MGIFLFTTESKSPLEPTQHPIQWVPGALSLGVKRPRREADHSPPSSAEVKNAWRYTFTPSIHLHGVVKVKIKFLCLTKNHTMKTYWGSGGIAPRILDLGTRWR
jgi:hypothetical protein